MAFRSLLKFQKPINFRHFSSEKKFVSVIIDDKTGVATVNLQRPPVNSLNLELLSELNAVLTDLEKNKSRGVVLTSKNDGVFSAGLDILEMCKPNPDRLKDFWTTLQNTWITLYGTSYPTVAVINGHAPAGGCLLSLSCEYRVMSKNFTIGLNETALGIVAPTWFISSMNNVIGQRQSEIALTTARLFTTDDALKVGLIDEAVASKEEGVTRALDFIAKFAKISPMARSYTKQSIRKDTIENMVKTRQADLDTFLQYVNNPHVQKSLDLYLAALKKKSSAKA